MKTLRVVVAAVVLVAACDVPGPSAPEHSSRSGVVSSPTPENAPPCDSACQRGPLLGGGGL